jgi:hypothetical protein
MCDTNENVTEMGVIIRRVYYHLVFDKEDLTYFGGA